MQGKQDGKSLQRNVRTKLLRNANKHTVALNHERLDNIMSNDLEVRMADPVTDGSFRSGEVIIEYSDLVAKKHKTVDKMRSDKTSTTCDQDALSV